MIKSGLTSNRVGEEKISAWVEKSANSLPANTSVLDAGCGQMPFKHFFNHTNYISADHQQYSGSEAPTHLCDLHNLPIDDRTVDLIVCTQVLEHVQNPLDVLIEFNRVLKEGGKVLLSAPLFFEEHEMPNDYFRFTRQGFSSLAKSANFISQNLKPVEGYFGTASYAAGWMASEMNYTQLRESHSRLAYRFEALKLRVTRSLLAWCSRYFATLELTSPEYFSNLTINYQVELIKSS